MMSHDSTVCRYLCPLRSANREGLDQKREDIKQSLLVFDPLNGSLSLSNLRCLCVLFFSFGMFIRFQSLNVIRISCVDHATLVVVTSYNVASIMWHH